MLSTNANQRWLTPIDRMDPFLFHQLSANATEAVGLQNITPNLILNSNLAKPYVPVAYYAVAPLFRILAQSTAMVLPCFVQNLKTICQRQWMLWPNEISRPGLVSVGLHLLQQPWHSLNTMMIENKVPYFIHIYQPHVLQWVLKITLDHNIGG